MSARVTVKLLCAAAALGATLAIALLAAAPSAPAAFSLLPCTGEGVFGRGASFQTSAVNGFRGVFTTAVPNGCGSAAPFVGYDPAGSGAGRRALGEHGDANPSQDRDPSIRWAGTDEPPTAAQRLQIERGPIDANGQDVTAADNGRLHVIPVAIGAITIMVRLPDNCNYSAATNRPLDGNRPAIDNETLEQVFAGEVETWGDAIAGVDSTCAA